MTANAVSPASTDTSSDESTPSPFPPESRYYVRPLTTKTDALWGAAVVAQSNLFKTPTWVALFPDAVERFSIILPKIIPLFEARLQGTDKLSFGIFDREYDYHTEEARNLEGKFYWDDWPDDETKKRELEVMTCEGLTKRMDYPLVAACLSYDGFEGEPTPHIKEAVADLKNNFPGLTYISASFESKDPRDPESWKPTAERQLLKRNATCTRVGYEGQGLSKTLTYYLLHEARRKGYQTMMLDSVNPVVTHIVMSAPNPFKAHLIMSYGSDEIKDDDGKLVFEHIPRAVYSRTLVELNKDA